MIPVLLMGLLILVDFGWHIDRKRRNKSDDVHELEF